VALRRGAPGLEGPEQQEGAGAQGREGRAAFAAAVRVESYLVLAVSPLTGAIRWDWIERMRQEHIRPVPEAERTPGAVVWDRAPSHRAKSLGGLGTGLAYSYPPTEPQAQPGREDPRGGAQARRGEGLRGPRCQAAGGRGLPEGASGRSRAGQELLCAWEWLREALESLTARRLGTRDMRHQHSELVLDPRKESL
jgi:hypothetical protein